MFEGLPGITGLAAILVCTLAGFFTVLLGLATGFYYLATNQRRKLERTIKNCGIEEYHERMQRNVAKFGHLQRAPHDITGFEINNHFDTDSETRESLKLDLPALTAWEDKVIGDIEYREY